MAFSDFALDPRLLRAVEQLGFTRPTPIQQDAIPPALAGRDLLACAMTGSGKTAAFLLPILQRLLNGRRGRIRALVLTPTRELAAQVEAQARDLARHVPLSSAAVFGGVAPGPQEAAFRRGVDILVATPGRLLDHLKEPYADLNSVEVLVLDEADRMLDMGFLPDIRRVVSALPRQRQNLLFSATMPGPIAMLAREWLRNPATINLERKSAPATGVRQALYPVPAELKPQLLLALLEEEVGNSVLVFTRTKHRANRLAEFLELHKVPNARLHGNRSQAQRTLALGGFKEGTFRVLVATDIAARGIDVEALEHVINFDVPAAPDDYIHRVGRTARAEATGDAFTLVSPDEETDVRAIERAIGSKIPRARVAGFDYSQCPAERFEIPLAERIAAIRARKAEERARARAKAERRAQHEAQSPHRAADSGAGDKRSRRRRPRRSGGGPRS